jgi:hypothetical protein
MTPDLAPSIGLIAALLAVTLGYAMACWVTPFARCRWCSRDDRKKARHCRWCRGTGLRLRIGRRVWNLWRRLHGGEGWDSPAARPARSATPRVGRGVAALAGSFRESR